jgi:hypothetical protein
MLFLTTRVGIEVKKTGGSFRGAARYRLTRAVAELEQEVKVRQLPLGTLEIAEGDAKTRHLAQVVSRGELYLPTRF